MTSSTERLGASIWEPPDDAAAQEFFAYSAETGPDYFSRAFAETAGAALELLPAPTTGAALRRWMCERLDRSDAASMIRLGDGEGNILFAALKRSPALTTYCLKRISKIWWGDSGLVERHLDVLVDGLLHAIRDADVVGAPGPGTLDRGFATPPEQIDVRGVMGMRGVYAYMHERFDKADLAGKRWASTWYSRDLLPHYRDIFYRRPFVGVISCYEQLAPTLASAWNISETAAYLVPMQASVRRDIRSAIDHFPKVFGQIVQELSVPFAGAPFVVAAGILGKLYCQRIKALGGFAIDVGSIADVWMGSSTRPGLDADFVVKWRLIA